MTKRMPPRLMSFIGLLCLLALVVFITLQVRPKEVIYIQAPSSMVTPSQQKEVIGTGLLRFVRENGNLDSIVRLDLDAMTDEELLMTIHSSFDNTNELCRRKFRMGRIGDGGWEICDDPDVRPREKCIIYSFGINYDFSFDDDAANMYGCHVYSFDPSMLKMEDQTDRSPKVHFYKLGIDGSTYVNNKNWSLLTYQDIRVKLGHQGSAIDVIKMDVESAEWKALPQMLETNQLSDVKQFLVEYHISQQSRGYVLPKLKAVQQLEKAGFKKFYVHKNPACKTQVRGMPMVRTFCYEVHYLRR